MVVHTRSAKASQASAMKVNEELCHGVGFAIVGGWGGCGGTLFWGREGDEDICVI